MSERINTSFSETVRALTGHTAEEIAQPLLSNLTELSALPFAYPNNPKRFRSSVQSTCLISLSQSGLLTNEHIEKLQKALLLLRNNWHEGETDFQGGLLNEVKDPQDSAAWCVTETPSVWATAYALWSLASTNFEDNQDSVIVPALDWLISQQDENSGGFPYQKHKDCLPTVYLTCLAIKALENFLFGISSSILDEKHKFKMELSLDRALRFIEQCRLEFKGVSLFSATPGSTTADERNIDWISTLWAYDILSKHRASVLSEPSKLFELLGAILADSSNSKHFWENNSFVVEGHTKYGAQKTYFYFMPSLLIQLISIGLPPANAIASTFMKQLQQTFQKDLLGWTIPQYRRKENCSFVTALALQTIYSWMTYLPQNAILFLLNEEEPIETQIRVDKEALNSVKRELLKTRKRLSSIIPYTGLLLTFLLTPWSNLFKTHNPLIMCSVFFLVIFFLWFTYLWVNQKKWRVILSVLAIAGSVATLVGFFWAARTNDIKENQIHIDSQSSRHIGTSKDPEIKKNNLTK